MQILTRETVQVNLNQLIHPITILQVLLNHITTDPITMFNFSQISKDKRLQRHLSCRQFANQHLINQLNCHFNGIYE